MSPDQQDSTQEVEMMYVQTAGASSCDGAILMLEHIAPATLYFSDRPERVVGHVGLEEFVGLWGEGENSFAVDPPNAVLAFLQPGGEVPEDVAVVLRDPQLDGATLTYSIEPLDDAPPLESGPCSLFIDPLGRPLSAGSVAGVHRRSRRRTGRRMMR